MSSSLSEQEEEYCRYRITPDNEYLLFFIDRGGYTSNPKATGFFAPRINYDTPLFGTQAFADFISSAWPTRADDRPALLRLHMSQRSMLTDFMEGDRVWLIKASELIPHDVQMWKASTLASYHTPFLDIARLNHKDTILLLNHIPESAVVQEITHLLEGVGAFMRKWRGRKAGGDTGQ